MPAQKPSQDTPVKSKKEEEDTRMRKMALNKAAVKKSRAKKKLREQRRDEELLELRRTNQGLSRTNQGLSQELAIFQENSGRGPAALGQVEHSKPKLEEDRSALMMLAEAASTLKPADENGTGRAMLPNQERRGPAA